MFYQSCLKHKILPCFKTRSKTGFKTFVFFIANPDINPKSIEQLFSTITVKNFAKIFCTLCNSSYVIVIEYCKALDFWSRFSTVFDHAVFFRALNNWASFVLLGAPSFAELNGISLELHFLFPRFVYRVKKGCVYLTF